MMRIFSEENSILISKDKIMIHAYTGDGKGKTTAAIGLLIRAFGSGKRVGAIFFDKRTKLYRHNELTILDRLGIEYHITGNERIMPDGSFRLGITQSDIDEGVRALELANSIISANSLDLLVLDEALTSVDVGLIKVDSLKNLIKSTTNDTELVLTGRCNNPELLDMADLVTTMVKQKHYFDKGVKARSGIEY